MTDQFTVAVTGGSGFIGSALVANLTRDPNIRRIFVLDLAEPTVQSEKIVFLPCDLQTSVNVVLDQPVDQCFHLAGIAREPGYEWSQYFSGNYAIARNVAAWATANNINNIVFTSTAMVFMAGEVRHAERDLPDPSTAYGIAKALAEEVLRSWSVQKEGRRLRILRPGVVFGRGCGGNFVNLYRALRRHAFVYIGRGSTVKGCIYIKDLVRLLRLLAVDEGSAEIYHGVYPSATTVKDVCEAFCTSFGWRRRIPTIPYKLGLAAASAFELLNFLGFKNPVHRRRIQKLYQSTDLAADNLGRIGFSAEYDLASAIIDWRADCGGSDLY